MSAFFTCLRCSLQESSKTDEIVLILETKD